MSACALWPFIRVRFKGGLSDFFRVQLFGVFADFRPVRSALDWVQVVFVAVPHVSSFVSFRQGGRQREVQKMSAFISSAMAGFASGLASWYAIYKLLAIFRSFNAGISDAFRNDGG